MKLILHIGQPKTGTTSIQSSLRNNKELLLKSGILYHAKNANGHFRYINILGGKTRTPENQNKQIQSDVYQEINEMQILAEEQNIEYILLSGESFFNFNLKQQESLIDLFNIKFEKIIVIAYVRDPAGSYFSGSQQKIKACYNIECPLEYTNNALPSLKRWSEFVGLKNIFVNPFDKNTLINNDVVVDFVKLLEKTTKISLSNFVYINDEKNSSLSAEQMILIQNYRKDFLSDCDGYFHKNSNKLIKFFHNMQNLDSISLTKAKLKSKLRAIISENNKQFIEEIDKYFNINLSNIFYKDNFESTLSYPEEEKSYRNIVDIIETYNQGTLDFLSQLIPDYNESIRVTSKGLPSHKSLDDPYFLLHYSKYLISVGIIGTSIDLLKRSYRKAKNEKINDSNLYYKISILFIYIINKNIDDKSIKK